MEPVYTTINNKIDPGLKEIYLNNNGYTPRDEMVKRFIRLESEERNVTIDDLLRSPIGDLIDIAEKYINQELKVITANY